MLVNLSHPEKSLCADLFAAGMINEDTSKGRQEFRRPADRSGFPAGPSYSLKERELYG
jgi:hypothetical protein